MDFRGEVLLDDVLIAVVIRWSQQCIGEGTAIDYIESPLGWFLFDFFNVKEFVQVIAQNMVNGFIFRFKPNSVRYGDVKDLFRWLRSLRCRFFVRRIGRK